MKYPLMIVLMLCAAPMAACSETPVQGASLINAISKEPLYAGIVKRADALKKTSDFYAATPSLSLLKSSKIMALSHDLNDLSARNLKASLDLKTRGTDNDLKCVLKGVSIDLKLKADSLKMARTEAELKTALIATSDLLSDNIDVIVTPSTAQSGMDCVLEFGGYEG